MIEIFAWFVIIIALCGTYLNIKQNKYSFLVWTFSNFCLYCINIHIEMYAQAALFAIYTAMSVYGFITWMKMEKNKKEDK